MRHSKCSEIYSSCVQVRCAAPQKAAIMILFIFLVEVSAAGAGGFWDRGMPGPVATRNLRRGGERG